MQTEQTACVSVLLWLGLLHSFSTVLQNTVVQMIPFSFVCPSVQFTQLGDLVSGRPHDEGR